MNNPFKALFHQFYKYSRSDRNAILILSGLILIVIISNIIYNHLGNKSTIDVADYSKELKELENAFAELNEKNEYFFKFDPNLVSEKNLDSLALPNFVKQNILNYRKAGGKFNVPSDLKKIYGMNDSLFALVESFIEIKKEFSSTPKPKEEVREKVFSGTFDPNTADINKLKSFGLNNFQAKNILNYRNKGGVFYRSGDLLKIYGIDSVTFSSIEKHVRLEKEDLFVEKIPKPAIHPIELNGADSLQLVKLKGIGPVYASRIIKYRNLLGGFYTTNQLLEVYNFPNETFQQIKNSVFVDSTLITPIRINFAEYNDLLKHPYLNKKQVGALLKYREKNGSYEKVSDIELVKDIDAFTFNKIVFYVTCR